MGSDGLDDATWGRVVGTVMAAHRGDVKAHDLAYRQWADLDIPVQRRSQIYIRYLLMYKLSSICGRTPRDDTLHDLAVRTMPKANILVKGNLWAYEELFRFVLGLPKRDSDHLSGAQIDILATAVLGALLGEDPAAELLAIRPQLAAYYRQSGDRLNEIEQGTETGSDGRKAHHNGSGPGTPAKRP